MMKAMVDRYQLAKLMKIELACVRRGSTCNRKCADCDLVQEDKALIAAYEAVIRVLEDPQIRRVTFCSICDYWDKESGLTARKCHKHGRITTQSMYCSEGKEIEP